MAKEDEQWGERLKQARVAAEVSQKNLGIKAGIDPSVASTRINRYELGVHKPDLLTARNLAKVLGVPVAFFYAGKYKAPRFLRWIFVMVAFTNGFIMQAVVFVGCF